MAQKTKQIYYEDAYLREMDACITDVKSDKDGNWWLTDRTIFYPGGGGQLADKGWLDTNPVVEIRCDDQGIWHLAPALDVSIGQKVKMEIDWQRRFFMMQQHSGQHLLSHVLHRLNLQTVSVHLGEEHTLIEVEGIFPDTDTLRKIESDANSLIQQHLNVTVHWTDRDSIGQFKLRRAAQDLDILRVLEIQDRDFSACGGTHVLNTAEIGLIKLLGTEKIRGNARIKFLIGQSAYSYLDRLHISAEKLKTLLQLEPDNQADRVTDILQDLSNLHKHNDNLLKKLVRADAKQISQQSAGKVIFHRLQDGSPEQALLLAKTLAEDHALPAFILNRDRFYFILPKNHPANANEFLRNYETLLSMRGGGPADFVQGIIQSENDAAIQKKLYEFIK